jgi:hypothetical protein
MVFIFTNDRSNVTFTVSSAAPTSNISWGDNVFIGRSLNADPYMSMHLNFLLAYDRPLTNAELDSVMSGNTFANGLSMS